MKVRLFEDLTDEIVELDIKTSAERNILVWGLTSAYGMMYKEICIGGHTFMRSEKR